ncbi:MAG: hypothetical protein H0T47_06560 [Planctomycetaceae bacterium]|nr:hypothetical protein [Planctomycetaceae bacterium]
MKFSRKPPQGGRPLRTGLGQLSLVEHALCPLDSRASLVENLVHDSAYHFTDKNRHQQTAKARIFCPLGLSAGDEFFLWGLLALTFSQTEPDNEFHAMPHFCLRRLGVIDQHARRGGRQYREFSEAIERLAAVSYRNEHFYDPVRAEHRKVSFGFLSYSLPLDPESSRAWRLVWDPIFFEFVQSTGGRFRFDLDTYRELDPAGRRLFLFVSKLFYRRAATPQFELVHLGVNVLGFSPKLAAHDLKAKVARCVNRLIEARILAEMPGGLFQKRGPRAYSLVLTRGSYFEKPPGEQPAPRLDESPLFESLRQVGLDTASITSVIARHPAKLLREWADITLAARERFGDSFFKKSPAAYFVDNVRNAAQGTRTPPDWWHELRKAERSAIAMRKPDAPAPDTGLPAESRDAYEKVRNAFFGQFIAAGQPRAIAESNARRFAAEHIRKRPEKAASSLARIGRLFE